MDSFTSMKTKLLPLGIFTLDDNSNTELELKAYAVGIDMLFEKLDELLREYFILTAETYGLTQREIFLGKERGSYSVEHRRNILIAQELLVEGRCNPEAFVTTLESYGLTDFDIVEDHYGGKVTINVRDTLTDAIKTMVQERVLLDFPAHLEIIVNFVV